MSRITRKKIVTVGSLNPDERARLKRELIAIFLQSFDFEHPDIAADHVIFRTSETRLTVLYDEQHRLCGFISTGVKRTHIGGKPVAVLDQGMYVRPGIRGAGRLGIQRLFWTALRFKLRHPMLPLCYVGEATSPVVYRLLMQLPLIHPRRGSPVPPDAEVIVREVIRQRRLQRVDDDPWRVHVGLPFGFRDPERITRQVSQADDPDMAFFVKRNPGYLNGHWLVLYAPYGLRHLLAAKVPVLRRWISNEPPS